MKIRAHRRSRLTTALAGSMIVAAGSLVPGGSQAATGDVLAEFDATITAGVPYCSINTGIAFDGESLILSCWYDNVLHFVDAEDHTNNGSLTVPGLSGIMAMAYDAGRDRLWVCSSDYYTIHLVDLATGALDTSIPPISTAGCIDGLAYDGTDDTLWSSFDVASSVQHYGVDSSLIGSLSVLGKIGSCGNSGIAVGGEDLFLGNNGCSEIYRANKDLSTSTHFATLGRRVEDMECDDLTFEGVGAIWAQDAYDRILTAYEVEPDLCGFGGGAAAAAAEAYVARVRADAVPLDSGTVGRTVAAIGDDTSSELHHVSVPGVAEAGVGESNSSAAETSETGTAATASARVANVSLLEGLVTAKAVDAVASATFDRDSEEGTASSDGSKLAGLVIDGEPIDLPVDPNTTISIPGVATIVLREEITNEERTSMRVNMIHVTSEDGSAEVVVSSAFASAGPGSAPGEPVEPVSPEVPEVPDPTSIPVPSEVPAPPHVGPPGAPSFSAGFEEGEAAWTTTGSWSIGTPPAGSTAHEGSRLAVTGAGGSYPNADVAALTSPVIDLTSYAPDDPSPLNPAADTRAILTWHQRFSTETYWDCGVVQASTDDGDSWATVTPSEGYNYTGAYCGGGYEGASFSGYEVDSGWTPYTIDLTGYAGEAVRVRFLFRSDGSVTGRGWHVDDLDLTLEPA
jgi:hypothetical protein